VDIYKDGRCRVSQSIEKFFNLEQDVIFVVAYQDVSSILSQQSSGIRPANAPILQNGRSNQNQLRLKNPINTM
jgi:hypothetical protein